MVIKEFQQSDGWKQAMDLVTEAYQATARGSLMEVRTQLEIARRFVT